MSRRILLLILPLILLFCGDVKATHNRAGEITYRRLSGYQFEAKIVTYTKTSSPADRPELEFWWGDGSRDTIPRTNIDFNVGPDIQRNTYIATHIYPGNGTYTMYFLDENRNGGIINIPGSVQIPFYVETQLSIAPVVLINNSPQLLQPPIDDGSVNRLFIHNPNAYDPDGDSLSYELTPCKGTGGQPIPTFSIPAASNSFTLDAVTGDLVWDTPMGQGEFNVAMIIREWRNIPGLGVTNIGYVTRDMQITIYPPVNDPPVILSVNDTCVEAGTVIAQTISASDPNNDQVSLSATGGPFNVTVSPATFASLPGSGTGSFEWNTNCAHVRKAPYAVVFKAEDNHQLVQLADLEQAFITVVGPSPKNPTVNPLGNSLVLNWDQSACSQAVGYNIYRRNGSYGFTPGPCETGVPAYTGYTFIGSVNGLSTTTYTDNNNGQGLAIAVNYCYMVTAFYPDGAESYASIEFCGKLIRDLPVITNADVTVTGTTNGRVYVAWSKPTQIDTTQMPGPYRYILQRDNGAGGWTDVVTYTDLNDTIYTDTLLNTSDIQYRYRIAFWNDTPGNVFSAGNSQTATTVFLSAAGSDEKNNLSWTLNVPWTNSYYVIYRENTPGIFDSIGTSATTSFVDDSLQNGTQYCYYIQSYGSYPDTGLVDPIINKSEIKCATPIDNEAPCVPLLTQLGTCESEVDSILITHYDSCSADIASISLYYAIPGSTDYSVVAQLPGNTLNYTYTPDGSIAGCYYITATDTTGNVSTQSATVCIDPCPKYELPNIFTPDDNAINDLFHPILPYRDVKDIDLKIYNRWGDVVFKTTDPDIGWNGRRDNTGEPLPDGVYYYTCTVNELGTKGIVSRPLTGFVHITRGTTSHD